MAEIATHHHEHTGTIDWSAAIWAGIVAGIVFMLLEMIVNPWIDPAPTPWAPVRMMGAVLLGEGVLPPPPSFDGGVLLAAMLVHFTLSILFGIVAAFLIRNLSLGMGVLVAALLGLALYFVVFYLLTPVLPWFGTARGLLQIAFHLIFGAVAGWWYLSRADPAEEHA